jgi:hypothetical protein
MNKLVKQVLGESRADIKPKGPRLKVIEATRSETFHVCPHCKQEIHEKSTFSPDGGVTTVHGPCEGLIEFPETPLNEIAAWLRPSAEQARVERKVALARLGL